MIEEWEILDALSALVDKSLVVFDPEAGGRYRLLETVREYGRARLGEHAEEATYRTAHCIWCLELAETWKDALTGPDQKRGFAVLDGEYDNLRYALDYACRMAGPAGGADVTARTAFATRAARIALSLARYWDTRGLHSEALERLQLVVSVLDEVHPLRSTALQRLGSVKWRRGDYSGAMAALQDALALARTHNNPADIGAALANIANVHWYRGERDAARPLYEESLAMNRAAGDYQGITAGLNNLGLVEVAYDEYEKARGYYEECLAMRSARGDRLGSANIMANLASTLVACGENERAREHLINALDIQREFGNRGGESYALAFLGGIERIAGNMAAAWEHYVAALKLRVEIGEMWAVASSLESLSIVLLRSGVDSIFVQFIAAANALRESIGSPQPLEDAARSAERLAGARERLGDAYEECWSAGAALTPEAAVMLALGMDVSEFKTVEGQTDDAL